MSLPSGEEGLADMRVLEAIERAIKSGRSEAVEPVERRMRPDKAQTVQRPAHGMPSLVRAVPPGCE